jgi:hypothetical protein
MEEPTPVGVRAMVCTFISAVILIITIACIWHQNKQEMLTRPRSRWTVFAIGVFCSAFLFNLGIVLSDKSELNGFVFRNIDRILQSVFNSIQMLDAGKDPLNITKGDLENWCFYVIVFVGHVLYILSPIAFLGAVASYVSRFLCMPRAVWRSYRRSATYVFSELGEPSLTLAKNILNDHRSDSSHTNTRPHFRKHDVSLVFASVDRNADDELQIRAGGLGALCVEDSVDVVWRRLFGHGTLRIVLVGKDEVSNITRAASIGKSYNKAMEAQRASHRHRLFSKIPTLLDGFAPYKKWMESHKTSFSIYSVTSLYGAESLLGIGEQNSASSSDKVSPTVAEEGNGVKQSGASSSDRVAPALIRRIDWTRNLVESTLNKHPLFLLGRQPHISSSNLPSEREAYLKWQNNMLDNSQRHVVIIGAGHVGIEFLRLALSSSRFTAPSGSDPLRIRFDVFDNVEDPLNLGEPQAKRRFEAGAPSFLGDTLAEDYDTHFYLMDVFDSEFTGKLMEIDGKHGGITYVFVALGDDLASVQVAMKVREALERIRVRRNATNPPEQRRAAYRDDPKPIILAIVDDDELSESLTIAKNEGFAYEIQTIGSYEDMYTFDLIIGRSDERDGENDKSEYKRRSSRASDLHKKYKLFAFMQHMVNSPCRQCAVNWSEDFATKAKSDACDDTADAILYYNTYAGDDDASAHEWLLRMEHERWYTYTCAEGFVRATIDEVDTFFDSCQTEERHRLNGANMHPCLVPYDDLESLNPYIDAWYDEALRSPNCMNRKEIWRYKRYTEKTNDKDQFGKHKPFQLQDNDRLTFDS